MAEIGSKFEKMMEKWKKEGRLTTLSQEETEKINSRIEEQMKYVKRDYEKRKEQSEIDAGKIYFTC